MNPRLHLLGPALGLLALALGCNMTKFVADSMPPQLRNSEGAFNGSRDADSAREAAPALLSMLDGFIATSPENPELLVLGARMNAAFAFAFLEEESPARARLVYEKAKDYGLRAIAVEDEEVADAIRSGDPVRIRAILEDRFELEPIDDAVRGQATPSPSGGANQDWQAQMARIFPEGGSGDADEDLLAPVFWTGFAWGSLINVNRTDLSAVADLPAVEAIMEAVARCQPGYFYGGAHLFEAIYYGSRSRAMGGNAPLSEWHFQRVFHLTDNKFLLAHVLYARMLCVSTQDRNGFIEHLRMVEEAPEDILPEQRLAAVIAHRRAARLMGQIDDLILPPLD